MNCLLVSIYSPPNPLQRNEFGGWAMGWMAPVGGDRPFQIKGAVGVARSRMLDLIQLA